MKEKGGERGRKRNALPFVPERGKKALCNSGRNKPNFCREKKKGGGGNIYPSQIFRREEGREYKEPKGLILSFSSRRVGGSIFLIGQERKEKKTEMPISYLYWWGEEKGRAILRFRLLSRQHVHEGRGREPVRRGCICF